LEERLLMMVKDPLLFSWHWKVLSDAPESFQIVAVDTSLEGLSIIQSQESPDLIILELPIGDSDIDNEDLLMRIRELTEIPVIVLSDTQEIPEVFYALCDWQVDQYLPKGISGLQLLARVRALLRRNRTNP
jgi:two-component system, OmpR family, KDP operon response regulator KdpE